MPKTNPRVKTWYLVEDNGNLLEMTGKKPPAWFAWAKSPWCDTPQEAIEVRRGFFQDSIDNAAKALETAKALLAAFEEAAKPLGR
jgi:hypothetical protein